MIKEKKAMERNQLEEIVKPLTEWYRKNSRSLPWRKDRNPYRVWVSEIMLQQTRVETVIPYFERFMKRFPDVASLAESDDEELFKLWEGLGYYSRAANLKKAARTICARHQGKFPETYEEIIELSGIGPYTAGAISSIAFEQSRAAVDGNVLRVMTRLTENGQDITDAGFRSQVTKQLEQIYPPQGKGDFTQSLMELGAVICVPNGEPRCGECPLAFFCRAYHNGTQLRYPVKKKKAPRKVEQKTVLILRVQDIEDRIAIRKRDAGGVLAGMWELPNLNGILNEQEVLQWLSDKHITVKAMSGEIDQKKQMKHIFTHIEWHMAYWIVDCDAVGEGNGLTWVTARQLENEIALPTAFKKVYKKIP